jgi:hypothetical protein
LLSLISAHANQEYDLKQLTNGHDFYVMLGLALRQKLGKRREAQTWGSEIAMHFRLAYSEEEFKRANTFKLIIEWQNDNKPFVILKSSLLRSE